MSWRTRFRSPVRCATHSHAKRESSIATSWCPRICWKTSQRSCVPTRRSFSAGTVKSWGSTARCTSPSTPAATRSKAVQLPAKKRQFSSATSASSASRSATTWNGTTDGRSWRERALSWWLGRRNLPRPRNRPRAPSRTATTSFRAPGATMPRSSSDREDHRADPRARAHPGRAARSQLRHPALESAVAQRRGIQGEIRRQSRLPLL